MRTADEIIENIQNEYSRRLEQGERHYQIKGFFAFLYVNKSFSKEEKIFLYQELLHKSFSYFNDKCNEIVAKKQLFNVDVYQELQKEVSPFQTIHANKLFLPFDDDVIFSIILSKAFLLAADDKIKDQVILNQINR